MCMKMGEGEKDVWLFKLTDVSNGKVIVTIKLQNELVSFLAAVYIK